MSESDVILNKKVNALFSLVELLLQSSNANREAVEHFKTQFFDASQQQNAKYLCPV